MYDPAWRFRSFLAGGSGPPQAIQALGRIRNLPSSQHLDLCDRVPARHHPAVVGRLVRIFVELLAQRGEMPRMLAGWVRCRCSLSISRMRSRSVSATVRPTSARVACSPASIAWATTWPHSPYIELAAVGGKDRVGADVRTGRQESVGAVNGVLQLAHIAGPAIDDERAARAGGGRALGQAIGLRIVG